MIPLPVETRWNYEVRTMRGFLRISREDMSLILDQCKLQHLKLTNYEYKKAEALVKVLEPFEEINAKLQGENFCTISMVAPSVFELEAHLELYIMLLFKGLFKFVNCLTIHKLDLSNSRHLRKRMLQKKLVILILLKRQ